MSRKALLLKLLALALCVDLLARAVSLAQPPAWFAAAEREVRRSDVRFLFIGSSRVAAAIDPDAFVRTPELGAAPGTVALDLGRGYQTLAESWLGLRRLADARPGGLKDVAVLIEAPMDVPELSTWSESWLHPDFPELLSQVMEVRDLPRFWRESATEPGPRWVATLALLSPVVELWGKGTERVEGAMRLLRRRGLLSGRGADLATSGGILADDAAVRWARASAARFVAETIARQAPFADADAERTVLRSIVELVRARGGRVLLFRMPISATFRAPHLTPMGVETRAAAGRALARWGVPVLVPDLATTDDDFPDLWHLRASRAAELSRSLARAYAAWARGGGGAAGAVVLGTE